MYKLKDKTKDEPIDFTFYKIPIFGSFKLKKVPKNKFKKPENIGIDELINSKKSFKEINDVYKNLEEQNYGFDER